jgi:hypothetical protein
MSPNRSDVISIFELDVVFTLLVKSRVWQVKSDPTGKKWQ